MPPGIDRAAHWNSGEEEMALEMGAMFGGKKVR
jgi:hypothetical protein